MPVERRKFLAASAGALACLAGFGRRSGARGPAPGPAAAATPDPALASALPRASLVVCDPQAHRVHIVEVPSGRVLLSHDHLRATHAVQLVPARARAFVHGKRTDRPGGALVVLKVAQGRAQVELDRDLADFPLHWQPRPDLSEIAYNTTGDSGLSIIDTDTLVVKSYPNAAGHHSLMAFLDHDVVASNDLVDAGRVRILDRRRGQVDAEVDVGPWPHGLSISSENGRAYCWCGDGVHIVGVRGSERGRHLGVIKPFARGQRCWFAWTPQGGRLSHDVSWSNGDVYLPYLTVVDAKTDRLERIESADRQPGTLTVSDDGARGLASSRSTAEALVFDLASSTYQAAIPIGAADPRQFFDRDLSLAPGGRWAAITNPADPSVSLLDLTTRREVARVPLAFRPGWTKLLLG